MPPPAAPTKRGGVLGFVAALAAIGLLGAGLLGASKLSSNITGPNATAKPTVSTSSGSRTLTISLRYHSPGYLAIDVTKRATHDGNPVPLLFVKPNLTIHEAGYDATITNYDGAIVTATIGLAPYIRRNPNAGNKGFKCTIVDSKHSEQPVVQVGPDAANCTYLPRD